MTTSDIREQLVLLVCGELDDAGRVELEAAMRADPALAAEAEQLAQAMRAVTPSAPIRVGEDFDQRLRRRLQEESLARGRRAAPLLYRRPVLVKIALAAAAAVLLTVGLQAWLGPPRDSDRASPDEWFSLLSRAAAAENAIFGTDGIVHIMTRITVHPVPADRPAASATAASSAAPDITWVPICSLEADGRLAFHQLKFAGAGEPFAAEDTAWYEPASGRFARVLRAGNAVIFANSFDGSHVYTLKPGPDGTSELKRTPVAKDFSPPKEPAAFLGISAGLRASLDKKDSLVQDVRDGTLADGSRAQVYTVGSPGPQGTVEAYWLFKVRQSDGTIAEKEFVVGKHTRLTIRRVLTERAERPGMSWTLAELAGGKPATRPTSTASVATDMVIPNITVAAMVKRADFETYTLAGKPAWTAEGILVDCLDVATPPKRMFMQAWRAADGRHVVMVQSPTYNRLLLDKVRGTEPAYTSAKGFKLFRNQQQEKWLAHTLLTSARAVIGDAPGDPCIAGLVHTPADTLIALAVNGKVSDEELHSLIDGLVPAKDRK